MGLQGDKGLTGEAGKDGEQGPIGQPGGNNFINQQEVEIQSFSL